MTPGHPTVLLCVNFDSQLICAHGNATPRVRQDKDKTRPHRIATPLVTCAEVTRYSKQKPLTNAFCVSRAFVNSFFIMFLTRLFRRNSRRQTEFSTINSDTPLPGVAETTEVSDMQQTPRRGRTIPSFSFFQSSRDSNRGVQPTESYHRLIEVLSRPRVFASSSDRVSTAVRLVDALRHLEEGSTPPGNADTRELSGTMSVFIALALRELDAIVDAMSYDELWDAFGGRHANPGLKESDIKAMPTRQMAPSDGERKMGKERDTCAICLEPFSAPQLLRDLPHCCHTFHVDCIDPWLRKKADCPVCRGSVAPASL